MKTKYAANLPSSIGNCDDDYGRYDYEKAPYTLVVECNSWVGNFERELIGYSMGILDEVQMNDVGYSEEERALFWKEVFNRDVPIEYEDEYVLKDKYLCELWEEVDDWEQATFYNVCGRGNWTSKETNSAIKIYLFEPIKPTWFEQLIVNRMYEFFEKKVYKWLHDDTKITAMYLTNDNGNIIKHYAPATMEIDKEELLTFYKAEDRTMTRHAEKEEEFLNAMNESIKGLNEILKELNELLKKES